MARIGNDRVSDKVNYERTYRDVCKTSIQRRKHQHPYLEQFFDCCRRGSHPFISVLS